LPNKLNWIGEDVVLAIHEAQIADHGGDAGIRDLGLLDSTLTRPKQYTAYREDRTVPQLAAIYALAITSNHPFVDGNKRVATVLLELFLEDNGYELIANDGEFLGVIMDVSSGVLLDDDFMDWVYQMAKKRQR
jgi:death-on-curing protein